MMVHRWMRKVALSCNSIPASVLAMLQHNAMYYKRIKTYFR